MNCPICIVPLVVTERQNVEIDYCPQCRGVWLDRGELDKIIDRSASYSPEIPDQKRSKDSRHYEERDDREYSGKYKKKKREGFLGELFDF